MKTLASITQSYRSLPLWVQLWVGLLVIVNAACVAFLNTPTGIAAAAAGVFVLLTNGPLMIYYGGMNAALSIPHLFAWIPLQIFLLQRLLVEAEPAITQAEWWYASLLVVVNGVSLAFDLLDSWRWLKGQRATPGLDVS